MILANGETYHADICKVINEVDPSKVVIFFSGCYPDTAHEIYFRELNAPTVIVGGLDISKLIGPRSIGTDFSMRGGNQDGFVSLGEIRGVFSYAVHDPDNIAKDIYFSDKTSGLEVYAKGAKSPPEFGLYPTGYEDKWGYWGDQKDKEVEKKDNATVEMLKAIIEF